jgi:type IV pilus assembly protein PilA
MITKNKSQQGFTLIELMIVIAIVGILAAIALPAYQDYIVRSKMSEPLAALAEAKTSIAEYVAANGGYPDSSSSFGVNVEQRDSSIMIGLAVRPTTPVEGGSIHVAAAVYKSVWEGGPLGDVAMFQLSGSTNADGTMTWECLPGGADGFDAVEAKYLPANCRG